MNYLLYGLLIVSMCFNSYWIGKIRVARNLEKTLEELLDEVYDLKEVTLDATTVSEQLASTPFNTVERRKGMF